MALNIEKIGRPLATIVDGGKWKGKIASITTTEDEEEEVSHPFKEIILPEGKFQQIPNPDTEREILYITGPSGSGKSTYTSKYVTEWKKKHKDGEIFVFSNVKEDDSIDKLKPQRIKIGDNLLNQPLSAQDFENSLVIFDDVDTISNKKYRDAVLSILNQILEEGRHYKTFCIMTNHLPTAGRDTRRILNEAHSITYFPHSGSARQVNYLLEDYIGLHKDDIKKIKKLKSRWATIYKNYPQIAMTEKNLFKVGEEEEKE